ncbi:carboxymuconolactone decarboxylase family protein [Deinococcus radiopugnans]|uniref:AhpD family alkylhydroperoxidase n=1 Tax=Deinococcus radiopugnans ATCC 19172 TaxID=585398 RepID=A0A5C4XUG0_9DEIO|nr:carboxymuconolactone decarboxylase family protein [Deinococcus radiopugnans]MBB6018584.1 AhpD family alkylhydroperoxidase [Deinococcus radiopugnans ATCC 19172]TNM67286.1 carboxymuconolactone decarboxylase family protein [Deinococcus radiopugnans ATCC 19172]
MGIPIDYVRIEPGIGQALGAMHTYVRKTALDPRLLHLIDIRVSQINGCAYCLNLHCEEARRDGELQQRLDVLAAWWETDLFTPAEQAALGFAEQLTHISTDKGTDALYAQLGNLFSEQEIVQLTGAVIDINAWNRLAIATGRQPKRRGADGG